MRRVTRSAHSWFAAVDTSVSGVLRKAPGTAGSAADPSSGSPLAVSAERSWSRWVRTEVSSRAWTRDREKRSHSRSNSSGERSEEHTSELQSRGHLVCRLLLEKK